MPLFVYKVITSDGKEKKGVIEGSSKNAVKVKFQQEGFYITELKEKVGMEGFRLKSLKDLLSLGSKKVPLGEIASMTRLLATLQKANIPLVESIAAVSEQQENPRIKEGLLMLKQKIQEGYSFSRSAKDFPDIFSPLYCNMIAAGEESGALDKVFMRLADFLEAQVELRNKVSSAMTYPIVLLGIAVIVVGVLFTTVIPKLAKMFEDIDMALPLQTRILIGMSDAVAGYWWLFIILFGLGLFLFRRYIKTDKGAHKWHRFLITMPVFGKINRMVAISRFSKTLSTLLESGVPILNAFDIVKRVIGNKILEDAIGVARENIKEGESIAGPLKRSGEFPPIVIHMVAIGEKSGELEEMLETLADSYEKEVNHTLDKLTSMLEPVMLVFLGGIVAFIVFSIIMPILQVNEVVG